MSPMESESESKRNRGVHMIPTRRSSKANSMGPVASAMSITWLAVALFFSSSGTSLADNMPRNVQSFETSFKATFGSFNMDISDEGRGVSLVLNQKSGCRPARCQLDVWPVTDPWDFLENLSADAFNLPALDSLCPSGAICRPLFKAEYFGGDQMCSGFRSKDSYLYGSFGSRMKLVPGNSAGIVVAFYLSSETTSHDEIDFEFLGNVSGQPWILQTNIFANGIGGREERTYLWFNPAEEHHSYSAVWNQKQIVFYVDEVPIRVYKNNEQQLGVPYPRFQPMVLFSSIFEASDWATRNGQDKIDWSGEPFAASYEKFEVNGCKVNAVETVDDCQRGEDHGYWWEVSNFESLSQHQKMQLSYARHHYLVYDYCTDTKRYSPAPQECSINNDS